MPAYLDAPLRQLLIAHRGGAALRPENTMAAFTHGASFGAHVLELDVHLSADGVVVVAHDATLERCTDGHGPLASRTFAELQRLDAGFHFGADDGYPFRGQGLRIPRLEEVLTAFPSLRFNIEAKPGNPALTDTFVRILRGQRVIDRCCIGSEDDALGAALVQAAPEACHFYPRLALTAFFASLWSGEGDIDRRYHVIDMPVSHDGLRLAEPAFIEAAHRHGRPVYVWTVDDAAEMHRLFDDGVDGVMTDRPDILQAVLSARAAPSAR
jgi:glycerophosphoryl diester phosphodiesterase